MTLDLTKINLMLDIYHEGFFVASSLLFLDPFYLHPIKALAGFIYILFNAKRPIENYFWLFR